MNKILMYSLLCIFLTSCSFSKDDSYKNNKNCETCARQMTSAQELLIHAVKFGDLEQIKSSATALSLREKDFSKFENTPMPMALEVDNAQAVSVLLDMKVDPFNLGAFQDDFTRRTFNVSNGQVRASLNLKNAQPSVVKLNTAEQKLNTELLKHVEAELALVENDRSVEALGLAKKFSLNCNYNIGQLVLLSQKTGIKNISSLEIYLKSSGCELDSYEIRHIYEIEIAKQFRKMFTSTAFLNVIAKMSNFTDKMVKLEDSGILVSPDFLKTVSRRSFNRFIIKKTGGLECLDIEDNARSREFCFTDEEENNSSVDSLTALYQVIDARPDSPLHSFTDFLLAEDQWGELHSDYEKEYYKNSFPETDPLIRKITAFMHGPEAEAKFNTAGQSWDIGSQDGDPPQQE